MRIERLFNPIKIILETPEEVAELEGVLFRHLDRRDWKLWREDKPNNRFLESLLKVCSETSKRRDF